MQEWQGNNLNTARILQFAAKIGNMDGETTFATFVSGSSRGALSANQQWSLAGPGTVMHTSRIPVRNLKHWLSRTK